MEQSLQSIFESVVARNPGEAEFHQAVREVFDLRPLAIINELDLRRPIYKKTAAHGHFGRTEPEFTWERLNRVDALRSAVSSS